MQKVAGLKEEDEHEEEEEEELGHAETYAEYMPLKCEDFSSLVMTINGILKWFSANRLSLKMFCQTCPGSVCIMCRIIQQLLIKRTFILINF